MKHLHIYLTQIKHKQMKTLFNFIKKHTIYSSLLVLIGIFSCHDDDRSLDGDSKVDDVNNVEIRYNKQPNLKKEFAKALLNAMKESKMLRDLLKTEALKMFNKEYDVLYLLIKDKQLENASVEELIAKHLGGKAKLDQIISQNPTLTILVPELPEKSFSAELWDTENDVPAVAIRIRESSGVPFIDVDGTEDIIPSGYTPGFPILVIKDNERVTASTSSGRSHRRGLNQAQTRTVYNDGQITLKFWHNDFDNSIKPVDKEFIDISDILDDIINDGIFLPPKKLGEAYNIYKNANGWQRDYIYYGITPSNRKGQYNNEYKEYIETFSMDADPEIAFKKIYDQESDWTDGSLEFKISTNINSKNGVGEQLINVLYIKPDKLFEFKRIRIGNFWHHYWKKIPVSLKTVYVHKPLFHWKLENYSPAIKMSVEEVDLSETYTRSETRTVEFATNFSIDSTEGVLEKVGLKFGASRTERQTQTNQISYTKEGDFLGQTIIEFSDDVITDENYYPYFIRKYSTGVCKLGVTPHR